MPALTNTLGLTASADRVVVIDREHRLREVAAERARLPASTRPPLTVLGGGSNVVLRRHVPGVVCLMRTRGVSAQRHSDGSATISAAAGERWHDLVRYSLAQGWGGLENLALIPGSVGAAPIQNVGAYGVELADRFVGLRAMDLRTGEVRRFDRAACDFGYRHSVFKTAAAEHLVVLEVTLRVGTGAAPSLDYPDLRDELARLGWLRPSPVQVAEAVIRVRRRKLPDVRRVGNVGSFFHNPEVTGDVAARIRERHPALTLRSMANGRVKLSAAQLIDGCGWKGRRRGRVGVWHRQPLVLVNRGGATGADVLALGEDIRRDVLDRYGITLDLEPRVIGQD